MAVLKKILLKNPKDSVKMDKIEVFGRVLSQKEIEQVFLKAENKILKEGLQKFRSVGV